MFNKKIVAISDAHLGQNGSDGLGARSLLSLGEPAIPKLENIIHKFSEDSEVALIGVGDTLDLSVAYLHDALVDLVNLLKKIPQVTELVLVVGNHDHHLFTSHCEMENHFWPLQQGEIPKKQGIYSPLSPETISPELTGLLSTQLLRPVTVYLAYPTMDCVLGSTRYIFTHGHLFGDIYTLLSDILAPQLEKFAPHTLHSEVLATTNLPIIEFIYWLLGEMGEGLGVDGLIEAIYIETQKGKKNLVHQLIDQTIDILLPNGVLPVIPDRWERYLIKKAARLLLNQYLKKPAVLTCTSTDRHSSLSDTRDKTEAWNNKAGYYNILVSGHTNTLDYWINQADQHHYNLGSWLLEPTHPNPECGILRIDTDRELPTFTKVE